MLEIRYQWPATLSNDLRNSPQTSQVPHAHREIRRGRLGEEEADRVARADAGDADQSSEHRGRSADRERLSESSPKRLAVPPCRELRPQRVPDPNQLRRIREPTEPDVVRLRPKPLRAERAIGFLDGLPSLLDRRE